MSENIGHCSRSWISHDNDSDVSVYITMEHRITVQEFLDYMAQQHPEVDLAQAQLNFATVRWVDRPTERELATREEWRTRQAERHEAWERKIYAELKAKFEGGEA